MSTKYIASNWRLPNQENSSKNDNYSLEFDSSTGEYIDLGSPSELDFETGEMTLSCWINSETVSSIKPILGNSNSGASSYQYLLDVNRTAGKISFLSSGITTLVSNLTITADTWYHICLTKSGTTSNWVYTMYINGSSTDGDTLSTSTNPPATQTVAIGKYGALGGLFFQGKISNFSAFNYALTSTQISTLYGSSSLGSGNPMILNPVAYYPLGDNSASNPLTQPNVAVEDATVFDFDSDVIEVSNSSDLRITGNMTLSAWIKSNNISSNQILISKNGGGGRNYVFWLLGSKLRLNTATEGAYSNSTLQSDRWYHVAISVIDGTGTFYVDGVADGSSTFTVAPPATDQPFYIGRGYSPAAYDYFDGEMSNVQVWAAGLLSTEVETLYNSGVPLYTGTQPQAANLKGWYKLNNTANWEADSAGNWQIPEATSAYPQSFEFDGSDYVNGGNSTELQIVDNLTISVWFKILNNSGNRALVARDTGSTQRNWSLYIGTTGTLKLLIRNNTDTAYNTVESPSAYDDGKWHHAAFVYTPSTSLILYVNGVAVDTNTTSITPSINNETADFTIGAYSPNQGYTGDRWTGEISNVQCWNSSLPATGTDSVETLYNNGSPLTTAIASSNLKAWYKLDNSATFSTNWSIPDASGNGNTGTSSGMTEQNLVNNNVSTLNGESSGMTSANLVTSDLTRAIPYDNYSFNFDNASSDYIDCGNDSSLSTSALTVSCWLKCAPFSPTVGPAPLSKDAQSNPNRSWGFLFVYTDFLFQNWDSAGNENRVTIAQASNPINTDGKWHHLVATIDGTTNANGIKVYIDNVIVGQATATATGIRASTENFIIGGSQNGGLYNWEGQISNVAIWNNGLSTTEVQKLYANGVPQDLSSFTPQPVAWYPLGSNSFWNGSAWTCRDMIGSNDGTGQNIGADGLVGDSPRSEANGTGTNMDVPSNLEGNTKWSDSNSWSINMSSEARKQDTP